MNVRLRSVRLRLTLWFGAALALIVLAFSLGIYLFVRESLFKQLSREMARDLAIVKKAVQEGPDELSEPQEYGISLFRVAEGNRVLYSTADWQRAGLDKALKQKHGRKEGGDDEKPSTAVLTARKKAPKSEDDLDGNEENEEKELKNVRVYPSWSWVSRNGRSYRLMASSESAAGRTFQIAVAHQEKPVRQTLRTLAMILLFGFPGALWLALGGGYFLAGRLLSPVGSMASKAQEITAERLSERLPVENPDDEFGRLATVFNATLARLEDSFERLRRFTADASHELRTPLTALRSVGEVALQDDLGPAVCRDVIGSMLEETDRLARLVDNLLILTRADSGSAHLTRESLDLTALVNDVTDCLGVLAEEKGQSLTVEIADSLTVEADRTTLRQALINLLDNAIKYTPAGGHIRLVVKRIEENAAIEVCDDGPGIPAEHRQKVFERFYRVGKDRSSETGGAGLGLAIARWAVEINGGRIALESEEGRGSIFRITLSQKKGADEA